MTMESLWARRGKSGESARNGRLSRARGTIAGRPGLARREAPDAASCLKALLASRTLLVAIKDLDGRYLEVNEAYARALGLEPQAVRGRLDRDLLSPEVAGEMAQLERLAMRGVALKPGIESFAPEAPAYMVERMPILDDRGDLAAICLLAIESPAPVASVEDPAPGGRLQADPPARPAGTSTDEAETLPPEVWLQVSSASNQLEWDAALYRSLLALFCQRNADFGARLDESIATGRVAELTPELGRLASAARSLGAIPLAGLAAELLGMVAKDEVAGVGGRTKRFERALDATIAAMESRIRSNAEPFDWPAAVEATGAMRNLPSPSPERDLSVA